MLQKLPFEVRPDISTFSHLQAHYLRLHSLFVNGIKVRNLEESCLSRSIILLINNYNLRKTLLLGNQESVASPFPTIRGTFFSFHLLDILQLRGQGVCLNLRYHSTALIVSAEKYSSIFMFNASLHWLAV